MVAIATSSSASTAPAKVPDIPPHRDQSLQELIEHIAHLLPAQGPITAFVHHNTLHFYEDLPFEDAVVKGARQFGCHPYLLEERYRKELDRERIRVSDLEAVLRDELKSSAEETLLNGTRLDLRMAMLRNPIHTAPAAELRWLVAESEALRSFREELAPAAKARIIERTRHWIMRDIRGKNAADPAHKKVLDSLNGLFDQFGEPGSEEWSDETWESFVLHVLWRACFHGVQGIRYFGDAPVNSLRHRDLLLDVTGTDADTRVHEILIRFCAAFADQGQANWSLPNREKGFFAAFQELYSVPSRGLPAWMQEVQHELARLKSTDTGPLESIRESLCLLGVDDSEREAFLTATFLALRGWSGMLWQMETRADRLAWPVPKGTLVEFLAIRLLLDRYALRQVASDRFGFRAPLDGLRTELRKRIRQDIAHPESRAFQLFQVAQFLEWLPEDLFQLSKGDWTILLSEIEGFSNLARRRVFHEAYERRYLYAALDAISVRAGMRVPPRTTPAFQATFCIDDREESFRRAIEEVAPSVETFAIAGFYGVAMYYRGAAEAHFTPLCPIVVRPQVYVCEEVDDRFEDEHRRRALHRRMVGSASHQVHVGSRTFAGGALLTTLLGPLASIPLIARVLAPRFTAQVRRHAAKLLQPPQETVLHLERHSPDPGATGDHVGFSLTEMADIGEKVLRDIGLISHFARLIFIFGHGSNSMNNPHKAAYDCGACAGAVGGPNARALAMVLNDPRVREILARRGLAIPDDSRFIGGWHNTCDDSMTFYDMELIPGSHKFEFERAVDILEEACDRDAHERCRRFISAPLDMTFEEARRHVQARSEDLAQTRPECGHASNAITVVGRRDRNRGLFMDRRAFLQSYEPDQDTPDCAILTRILQAVVPVCAGIALEYYFSYVDNVGWGSGTKLPHNVASLLGVMDGHLSDLRTGLPWQMVEIHEPLRQIFVIETTPTKMQKILDANPGIRRLCVNRWVYLATLDPESDRIHLYRNGVFEPYSRESHQLDSVASSADWYRGWRDNLGFVLTRDALKPRVDSQTNGHAKGVRA